MRFKNPYPSKKENGNAWSIKMTSTLVKKVLLATTLMAIYLSGENEAAPAIKISRFGLFRAFFAGMTKCGERGWRNWEVHCVDLLYRHDKFQKYPG
mmetsp:Transcript_19402/g.31222  ORF Transcript_19402/g.31222 Transcript_19402/m.31222 type:complete len:96 (+) Transcript_19402:777-1064(+)